MATGQVIMMLADQGAQFSDGSINYVKLNGQSVSRTEHEVLSAIWPSGAYGGGNDTEPMHMPDTDGMYLRGYAFNSTNDPEKATRTALSGALPVGNQVGSFQSAQITAHFHVSGSQNVPGPRQQQGGGGEPAGQREQQNFSQNNAVVRFAQEADGRYMEVSTSEDEVFDVDHTICYFYVCDA
jgi:hypothetical protein|tara:strand:+ start:65883 stop:66428 length:546 start_codon:yes stop_codon:yes gene_type:complete